MTLHFDLTAHQGHFRECWLERIRQWAVHAPAAIASAQEAADFIIDTAGDFSLHSTRLIRLRADSPARKFPGKTFAWDCGDFPTGRMPGLYCSLPRAQFDPVCHSTYSYPLRYNSCVRLASRALAVHLLGFTGQISSPLRARLFATLATEAANGRALLRQTDGSQWGTILAAGASSAKEQYADDLARCKFILCPRGNGVSSIRLFEALEAGRVPVILSDRWVPPAMIDWTTCSLRIKERDLPRLTTIVQEREADWPELAAAARRVWESHFADPAVLGSLTCRLGELAQAASVHRRWSVAAYFPRLLPALVVNRVKNARRHITGRISPALGSRMTLTRPPTPPA